MTKLPWEGSIYSGFLKNKTQRTRILHKNMMRTVGRQNTYSRSHDKPTFFSQHTDLYGLCLLWCHFRLLGDFSGFCGSDSRATVCSKKLFLFFHRLLEIKELFISCICNLWNLLPQDVMMATSWDGCTKKLHKIRGDKSISGRYSPWLYENLHIKRQDAVW